MRQLNYELSRLVRTHREGSFSTQAARSRILSQCADELHELGFRKLASTGLKVKHVEGLVAHWHRRGLSAGTIKNRMAHLRWWAGKVGRPGVVRKDNDSYGIAHRQYVTNVDRSARLDERLNEIRDDYTRVSLQLQAAFGLRREEAIKFQPSYADKGDRLVLKPSWTKGGKAREIPIRTDDQRQALKAAYALAGRGSLIPPNKMFIEQLKVYERRTTQAGFSKLHGLRHAYAMRRYEELTGRKPSALGGPKRSNLSDEEREKDAEARLVLSRELGHERLEIVAVYVGS
ncbi:MAG: phage integrase N-terminal domain-containing protein [Burkholderiaceae bacterium]